MRLFGILFVVLLALCSVTDDARACGAFAGPRELSASELPFLTIERVLLVWDKTTGTEDFVRETRFDRANQSFGFVVPVPTRPEVSAVTAPPWDTLSKAYPFDDPATQMQLQMLGANGGGAPGAPPPPVAVIATQRIGSFTAFTLSATDAGALGKWLADNGLVLSPEAKPWTERYIASKYYFVAFRYEPKGGGTATPQMTSETVRIRFTTPNPYYPYMEPSHPKANDEPRMLTGWIVTEERMRPVAARAEETGERIWVSPWEAGLQHRAGRDALGKELGAQLSAILPKAPGFVVQAFRDRQRSRDGYGDVVLVPRSAQPRSAAEDEARGTLLTAIDPTLLDDAWAAWPGARALDAPPRRAARCSIAGPGLTAAGSWFVALVAGAALVLCEARRRRAWVAPLCVGAAVIVLLLACNRPRTFEVDAAVAVEAPRVPPRRTAIKAAPAAPLPPREERAKIARAILAGETPNGAVESPPKWRPYVVPPEQVGRVKVTTRVLEGAIANIEEATASFGASARSCYARPMWEEDPTMRGTTVIDVVVDAKGAITSTTAGETKGVTPAVAACCEDDAKRLKLEPRGEKGAKVRLSLAFSPE